MDDANPVTKTRMARGLSRADLAVMLNRPYSRITAAELGHLQTIPADWRPTMEVAGFDFDALSREYVAWRANRAAALCKAAASG